MKDYSKFTVHRDPTGDATGYNENLTKIAAHGHQVRAMSADNYGPVFEAFDVAEANGVEAVGVYRPTTAGQEGNSRQWNYGQPYQWDTPGNNYTLDVQTAISNHLWAYSNQMRSLPEWKEGSWFLFWNEIDRHKLEYASQIALGMAEYAVEHGLRFAFFGLNSGEPDTSAWSQPHMAAFLRYAAANPDHVALALHEYSFNKDISNDFGWEIGRFKHLVSACLTMGIPFEDLRIFITECGHGKDTTVAPNDWRPTVDFLAGVYGPYANIQLVALWAISDDSKWDGPQLSSMVRQAYDYAADQATGQAPVQATFSVPMEQPVATSADGTKKAGAKNAVKKSTRRAKPKARSATAGQVFDLQEYVMPSGVRQYMIKNGDGSQEKYRPQPFKNGHLIQKNGNGEYYEADGQYIYLVWDTSPNATEFYRRSVSDTNDQRTSYLPRYLHLNETWNAPSNHYVRFFNKSDCSDAHSPSEGWAGQTAYLVAHHDVYETAAGGTANDVVVIKTGPETQYYAKGIGRIGWTSTWGDAWMTAEDINGQSPEPLDLPPCLR